MLKIKPAEIRIWVLQVIIYFGWIICDLFQFRLNILDAIWFCKKIFCIHNI